MLRSRISYFCSVLACSALLVLGLQNAAMAVDNTAAGGTIRQGVIQGGTQVATGTTSSMSSPDAGAPCARVTNNTGRPLFVPNGNRASWDSFVDKAAAANSGIVVASCDCAAQNVAWGSCGRSVGALVEGGAWTAAANTNAGYSGSANVRCAGGVVEIQAGSTCTPLTCNLPWGGTIANGATVTAYSAATQPCGGDCGDVDLVRTCTNGTLSGSASFNLASCSVNACSTCPRPGGGAAIAHGANITAYSSATPAAACTSVDEVRNCNNGVLSGTYTNLSCTNGCTGTPWGAVATGYSNTAYTDSTPNGACTTVDQVRTCTNGTMSGTATFTSCTAGCTGTPWGAVATGYSNTAYTDSTPNGACSTVDQVRTCTNGTMSGTATFTSCTAGCAAQGVSWTVSTRTCSGTTTAVASGGSTSAEDTGTPSGTATYNCVNGNLTLTSSSCVGGGGFGGAGGGGCFVSGTKILLADGSTKVIDAIKQGDIVKGEKYDNFVFALDIYETDEPTYSINGSKHFITGEHPVQTTEGWKSIDPELTRVEYGKIDDSRLEHQIDKIGMLEVGDVIYGPNGRKITVRSIDSTDNTGHPQKLYNIRLLRGGDHTYFADGILVHNVVNNMQKK